MFRMINHRWRMGILLIFSSALYVSFLSVSLDEWDSVQFALGMLHYDVAVHQPHPPGYPVYIFFGWILYRVSNDPLLALTLLSAVCGALTVVTLYYLVRDMFNEKVAILSSLLLAVNPLFWLTSEKALSDTPGTFFVVLAVSLLHFGIKKDSSRMLYASAFVLGLSVGVRQTNFPFAAAWVIYLFKNRKKLILCAAIFALTCVSWFIPMVYLTGFSRYLEAFRSQALYAASSDFIFGQPLTALSILRRVFYEYLAKDYLWIGFGAIPYYEPEALKILSIITALILLVLSLQYLLNLKSLVKSQKFRFIIIWTVPYLTWMLLAMSPFDERKILPTIPPLCVLIADAYLNLSNRIEFKRIKATQAFRFLAAAFFILLFFLHTVYFASVIHTVPSPPTQMVYYVNSQYDPKSTIILYASEKRFFDYFETQLETLDMYNEVDLARALKILQEKAYPKTVLVTGSAASILNKHIPNLPSHLKLVKLFEREYLVHRKGWQVSLYEYPFPTT